MPEITLTPRERQALKARAHGLKPVVLLGASGLSPAVMSEIDRALAAHELIKVKVPGDDRAERVEIFATVADRLSAARVQAIGKLLVLFRPAPDAEQPPAATPRRKEDRTLRTDGRSPKAPASVPRGKTPSTRSDAPPKRTREDARRVSRTTAPRRDAGTARRAAGRSNAPRGGRGR